MVTKSHEQAQSKRTYLFCQSQQPVVSRFDEPFSKGSQGKAISKQAAAGYLQTLPVVAQPVLGRLQ